MYLSDLIIGRSHMAHQWAARPYRVHQRLCLAFPDEPTDGGRVLFRVEDRGGDTAIVVQSGHRPDWTAAFGEFPVLQGAPLIRLADWRLQEGQTMAFRLRANPTRRKVCSDPGSDGLKRRVGITDEIEQLAWLARKGEAAGFSPLEVQVRQDGLLKDTQTSGPQPRMLALLSVQFDGILQVTDPERLRVALAEGIGSGKGLGFGLLSLGT